MVERGILHSDGGILWIGEEGERRFGHRHFLELLSVFASPPLVQVLHGRRELGEVHQSSFMLKEDKPAVLSLAGRAWRTKYIDWARRRAYVEPTDERGRSRWLSAAQPLHYALCRAMLAVLAQDEPPVRFSRRALEFIGELRLAFEWAEPGKSFLVADQTGDVRWWTFAGKLANVGLAQALQEVVPCSKSDNLAIHFTGRIDMTTLRSAIKERVFADPATVAPPLDQQFIAEFKFSACLPSELRESVLARRYSLARDLEDLATQPLAAIHDGGT
jgi:ATP-dependent Lhr-like helicase